MSHGQELPEVVDKSPEEISQIINVIEKSDLPDNHKKFAVSCIRVAIWLPNALLAKKISIFNLHKLIFGGGQSKQHRSKKDKVNSSNGDNTKEDPDPASDNTLPEPSPDSHDGAVTDTLFRNIDSDKDKEKNDKKPRGHGRNSHKVYTNALSIILQLTICL